MKHISITLMLFVLFQLTSFGQMQKFPKQNPDSSYNVSFRFTAPNTDQLFYWFSGTHLLQSRSTDNGVNWSAAVVIINSVVSFDTYPNEITGIVLNTGRIFLVYRNFYYYSVYSDNNGQSWSAPIRLSTGTGLVDFRKAHNGSMAQSATGKLFLVYSKAVNDSANIRFIASSDNGSTWNAEQFFAAGPESGTIAAINNNLILIYQKQGLYSSFSTDDGVTWNYPGSLILNDTTVNNPKVVKDQSGQLWLFYEKNVQTPFTDISQQDILYKTSSDVGLTWGIENNFTRYKGPDSFYNLSVKGNNPLVSFSSDRGDTSRSIYGIWYGTAGVTQDINTQPYFYKYDLSIPNPLPDQQFDVHAYIDCPDPISSVMLNRTLNGVVQSSLSMYDDGTHGDLNANDKIYTCQVAGLGLGAGLQTYFNITDHQLNSIIYNGPSIIIPIINGVKSAIIDVNRFKLPVGNNGVLGDLSINNEIGGGKYDGNIVMFSGGFFLTGKSHNTLWSNGQFTSDYMSDYLPGKVGSDIYDPKNILFVVRSTDPPFGQSWQNWSVAVKQGAAFYDGNHDGIYNPVDLNGNDKWDPDEDRPDLLGDVTAWCVFNDSRPSSARIFNDVAPQGIEIQQTVFAQKDSADLNNVIFVKYRLINTGTVADVMDSVYFGIVDDADIGDSGMNDLAGCDTLLNSVYTYHKLGLGDSKWGTTPPAETITLLQGPFSYIPGISFIDVNGNGIYDAGTDTPIDTAYNFGGPLVGKSIYPGAKNLGMTSANQFFKNIPPQTSIQANYVLTGHYRDGSFINPCTWTAGQVLGGLNCKNINPLYVYSGDPLIQMGWINTVVTDQRNILSCGSFKLEKNNPVDIIVAYIVGRGSDNLNSITIAKQYAGNTISYYKSNFPKSIITSIKDFPSIVNDFRLYQNYPNPFNPTTRIKYSVSTNSLVSIKVYNILGREVAILLNEQKHPGDYEITFNSGKYNLASGVYFYKLVSGGFTSVKKMMLLK